MARRPMTLKRTLLIFVVFLGVAVFRSFTGTTPTPDAPAGGGSPEAHQGSGTTVEEADSRHLSGVMLDASGVVDRTLPDDNDGSRHQRFILELASGHTVLVAHNIDLARRVPLAAGDRVQLHGQYEWNERGGVLHWTHHDPGGRHQGGWIEHEGHRYE